MELTLLNLLGDKSVNPPVDTTIEDDIMKAKKTLHRWKENMFLSFFVNIYLLCLGLVRNLYYYHIL